MLLGHWVKLEWLELMEMQTRATRIGFLETLAFPVIPVALAACHLPDELHTCLLYFSPHCI